MFALVFSILLLTCGMIAGLATLRRKKKSAGVIVIAVSILLPIIIIGSASLTVVEAGHTGVVVTYGKVEDYTFDAGLHAKAPWNTVVQMDNRVQKASISLSCFSSDIQEVSCQYTLNYQISKSNAQDIYRTIGVYYFDTVITPNVQESVKTIMAHYSAENLIGNRDTLAEEIEELLSKQLVKYNIEVVSTAIEDMDFTEAFTAAVEEKQVAAQNKLKEETIQAQMTMQAQQQAERNKIEANAAAEVAKIQAQADMEVAKISADSAEYQGKKEAAIALQRLASINGWTVVLDEASGVNKLYKVDGAEVTSEELKVGAENLIRYYYIQQWNGVLPETYVGSEDAATIILPQNS